MKGGEKYVPSRRTAPWPATGTERGDLPRAMLSLAV